MEYYLGYPELELTGFDLDPRFVTTAQQGFQKFIQLFQSVRTSGNVIAVDGEPMSQGFKITLSVSKLNSTFVL